MWTACTTSPWACMTWDWCVSKCVGCVPDVKSLRCHHAGHVVGGHSSADTVWPRAWHSPPSMTGHPSCSKQPARSEGVPTSSHKTAPPSRGNTATPQQRSIIATLPWHLCLPMNIVLCTRQTTHNSITGSAPRRHRRAPAALEGGAAELRGHHQHALGGSVRSRGCSG